MVLFVFCLICYMSVSGLPAAPSVCLKISQSTPPCIQTIGCYARNTCLLFYFFFRLRLHWLFHLESKERPRNKAGPCLCSRKKCQSTYLVFQQGNISLRTLIFSGQPYPPERRCITQRISVFTAKSAPARDTDKIQSHQKDCEI